MREITLFLKFIKFSQIGALVISVSLALPFTFSFKANAQVTDEVKIPSVWSGATIARHEVDPSLREIYEHGFDRPYIAETRLNCGGLDVLVKTYCEKVIPGQRPSCHSQKLYFGKRGKTFKTQTAEKEETIGYYVDCLKADNGNFWIVLQSGNFGSGRECKDCERSDYFNKQGEYLGSDKSDIGLQSVRDYKIIPDVTREETSNLNKWNSKNNRTKIKLYPSSVPTSKLGD